MKPLFKGVAAGCEIINIYKLLVIKIFMGYMVLYKRLFVYIIRARWAYSTRLCMPIKPAKKCMFTTK
jgi:hypothetical protein